MKKNILFLSIIPLFLFSCSQNDILNNQNEYSVIETKTGNASAVEPRIVELGVPGTVISTVDRIYINSSVGSEFGVSAGYYKVRLRKANITYFLKPDEARCTMGFENQNLGSTTLGITGGMPIAEDGSLYLPDERGVSSIYAPLVGTRRVIGYSKYLEILEDEFGNGFDSLKVWPLSPYDMIWTCYIEMY